MTKFMKNCSIIALGMIGAGIIFSIISGVSRGWKAIPLGELLASATHGRVQIPSIWPYSNGSNWESYLDGLDDMPKILEGYDAIDGDRKEYSIEGDVQKLKVETGACIMEVGKSEDGDFHVETVNMKDFQCYVKGGTLYLKSTQHVNHINDALQTSRGVKLYVPEGTAFSDIDIEFGAGSIELGDLTADKIELDIGAGWVSGQEINVNKMAVSIGSGSATLKEVTADNFSVEVGMGSLEFSGSIQSKADVECAMGSVEMELEGAEADFNYDIESAMGSLQIGKHDYSGLAKEKKINNGASKKIEVECAMGSIEISFKE